MGDSSYSLLLLAKLKPFNLQGEQTPIKGDHTPTKGEQTPVKNGQTPTLGTPTADRPNGRLHVSGTASPARLSVDGQQSLPWDSIGAVSDDESQVCAKFRGFQKVHFFNVWAWFLASWITLS